LETTNVKNLVNKYLNQLCVSLTYQLQIIYTTIHNTWGSTSCDGWYLYSGYYMCGAPDQVPNPLLKGSTEQLH